MKRTLLLSLSLLITILVFGQSNSEVEKTKETLKKYNVKQFYLEKWDIYFGDSISEEGGFATFNRNMSMNIGYKVPIVQRRSRDTIVCYTVKEISGYDRNEIRKAVKRKEFGNTAFFGQIMPDGRIYYHDFQENIFLLQNDTLYQRVTYTYRAKDSIGKGAPTHFFRPLFSCHMFKGEKEISYWDQNNKKITVKLLAYWDIDGTYYYKFMIKEGSQTDKEAKVFIVDSDWNFVLIEKNKDKWTVKKLKNTEESTEDNLCQ